MKMPRHPSEPGRSFSKPRRKLFMSLRLRLRLSNPQPGEYGTPSLSEEKYLIQEVQDAAFGFGSRRVGTAGAPFSLEIPDCSFFFGVPA